MSNLGILASIAAAGGGWPSEFAQGIPVPGGIDPSTWDAFHSESNEVLVDQSLIRFQTLSWSMSSVAVDPEVSSMDSLEALECVSVPPSTLDLS